MQDNCTALISFSISSLLVNECICAKVEVFETVVIEGLFPKEGEVGHEIDAVDKLLDLDQ